VEEVLLLHRGGNERVAFGQGYVWCWEKFFLVDLVKCALCVVTHMMVCA